MAFPDKFTSSLFLYTKAEQTARFQIVDLIVKRNSFAQPPPFPKHPFF